MKPMTNIIYTACAFFAFACLPAVIAHADNLYVTVNGAPTTNSSGSIFEYTSGGVQSPIAGLALPRGIAFDSNGNLFVGTTTQLGNNEVAKVLKFTPQLKRSVLGGIAQNFCEGVATDSSGNVFAVVFTEDAANTTIYKFTPNGGESVFAALSGQGFGLATDAANNLYVAVNPVVGNAEVLKITPGGSQSVVAVTSDSTVGFAGIALDSSGSIFVSTESNPGSDKILKFTAGVESTFATGLNTPRGLAFDSLGNLYVAEFVRNGDILKFTPGGAQSVFASGLARPQFLTFGPAR